MSFTRRIRQGPAADRGGAAHPPRSCMAKQHPDVAKSLGDLGVNFGERGDFKQAESYLRQALALQRKLHTAHASGPGRGHQQPRLGHAERRAVRRSRDALSRGARHEAEALLRRSASGSCDRPQQPRLRPRDARRLSRRREGVSRVARDEPQAARRQPSRDRDRDEQPRVRALRQGRSPAGDPDAARFDRDEPAIARVPSIRTWRAAPRTSPTG